MWCSEQAVGEDVIPLLLENGICWTISDETILARSLSGVSHPTENGSRGANLGVRDLQRAYRLDREEGQLSIIFRDHTLSDLIGFAYCRWNARDAANDLLYRLREIHRNLDSAGAYATQPSSKGDSGRDLPLVTIALDGENAWEYYARDGRDFLQYLYEGLQQDPSLRCVTVSEHLAESPAVQSLGWLHTGSWIGGDLGTWIGDRAHGVAWELLREARENIDKASAPLDLEEAREQVRIAEGSDWFWWFGDHHHTSLDAVWDLTFRQHLQESYRLAGTEAPLSLSYAVCGEFVCAMPAPPSAPISPNIDGLMEPEEWVAAGRLATTTSSTMQRAGGVPIREVRHGSDGEHLFLLIVPDSGYSLGGTEIQVQLMRPADEEDLIFILTLAEDGGVRTECKLNPKAAEGTRGVWKEVVEISLPLLEILGPAAEPDLTVRIGHDGMVENEFHSAHYGP
jgi:alpha-amylase/alpha-mannosidase (GH57 family)